MRVLSAADMHISDELSYSVALECFERVIAEYRPELLLCLGDLFDNRNLLLKFGGDFYAKLRRLHDRWLFVFGNHDGSDTSKGRNERGNGAFSEVFGPAQSVQEFGGRRFITLANAQHDSGWESFADEHVRPKSVLLAHEPLNAEAIERIGVRGAQLILAGHRHAFSTSHSADGSCEQRVQPPFLFGGRTGDPAGFNVIDFDADGYTCQWVTQTLPCMPSNARVVNGGWQPPYRQSGEVQLASWCAYEPCRYGTYQWFGGPGKLECYRDGVLQWGRSYGRSGGDTCPPKLVEYRGKHYAILGGTWVTTSAAGAFASVIVVDPFTGDEHYRVPVIGVSCHPTVMDGVMYIVGQWREIIAVELETGRELWRQRSQVETEKTKQLSWHDCQTGGGWSVCAAAVARHVWTVNARGDLFGYERETGRELFVYPMSVPLNQVPNCPFANRLACAPGEFTATTDSEGNVVFAVNGLRVHDVTGALLSC